MNTTQNRANFFNLSKESIVNNEEYKSLIEKKIEWEATGDPEFPFRSSDNLTVRIRVNDFPAEPLYSIMIGDTKIFDINTLPKNWIVPFEQALANNKL